jgi:hypothetical protein
MPPVSDLFLPDGQDQPAIHIKRFNSCSAAWSKADQVYLIPSKMISPYVSTRIEDGSLITGLRVNGKMAGAFTQGAGNAGQRQVIGYGLPACRHGDNVIDVKSRFLPDL